MITNEQRQEFRDFIVENFESIAQYQDKFSVEEREAFRDFVLESDEIAEITEATISANLNIPTSIVGSSTMKDSDEKVPEDVESEDFDPELDDTDDMDRSGISAHKAGSGSDK